MQIKLITERDAILNVAEHFKTVYSKYDIWDDGVFINTIPYKDVYNELNRLDLYTAKHKDVEKILGNNSWTKLYCSICLQSARKVLSLHTTPISGRHSCVAAPIKAHVCYECFDDKFYTRLKNNILLDIGLCHFCNTEKLVVKVVTQSGRPDIMHMCKKCAKEGALKIGILK